MGHVLGIAHQDYGICNYQFGSPSCGAAPGRETMGAGISYAETCERDLAPNDTQLGRVHSMHQTTGNVARMMDGFYAWCMECTTGLEIFSIFLFYISLFYLGKFMKYYFFTSLVLTIFSVPLLAENEVTFEPSSGIVTIPQVIILGDKESARFNVKMKLNGNGNFTLVQLDKTSASIDTAVEKYITLDTKETGRLVYGQMLERIYSSSTNSQLVTSKSLPPYITNYVRGAEVRLYHNNNATLLGKALTDSNGFYQISVEAIGSYKICFGPTNEYCGTFTSGGAPSQRCDYNDLSGGIKPGVYCTSY